MGRTLAVANQKGGVGKTTTTINLGAALATADLRVLLVDLDPQGNATSGLGLDKNQLLHSIYDVLCGTVAASEAVHSTELGSLDLLPANRDLTGATVELLGVDGRETQLKRALSPLKDHYDFILVDCPPSLGIMTINALVAADSLIIPMQAEYLALEGLSDLIQTIGRVRQGINPSLHIEGVLLTMYDERLTLGGQIKENVKKHLGDRVFSTFIPRNVRLAECPSFGKPILLYDARSKGAESHQRLAKELLRRMAPRPSPHNKTHPLRARP